MKSYHDLTAQEREKVAAYLDLLDAGGIFGVAIRYYRDQERALARMAKAAPAADEPSEPEVAFPW